MRLKKRILPANSLIINFFSILISLSVASIIFILYGINPFTAFFTMVKSAFFDEYGIKQTIIKTVPLALCAFSVIMCFKMNLWNVGADGQLYIGGLFSSIVALKIHTSSAWITIPIILFTGLLFGGLWGLLAGFLKAKFEINEILSTLMLNYIAITLTQYAVYGPFKGPDNFPYSEKFSSDAILPTFYSNISIGILIVCIIGILLQIVMSYSKFGFNIKICGSSRDSAEYSGKNFTRNIITVFIISGALSGLAGMIEVTGVQHRLQPIISNGYGFTGILIAWLSRKNFVYSILIGFLFSGLIVSGEEIQIAMHIPNSIVNIFQGILILSFLGLSIFKEYRLVSE